MIKELKESSNTKLDKLKKDTSKILKVNKHISKKLNVVVKDRVIHTGYKKDINHLMLIRNNSNKSDEYEYTVIRTMKSNVETAIKKHKES